MNDIQVFLTVRIRNTGPLAAIGNFFLAPARYFFSGKSIAVMQDEGITEVPSFYYGRTIKARRESSLQSTDTDIGYAQPFVYWIGFTLALIPGIIFGSFFKGLSYIKNPVAQKNHTLVKEKLTPKDMRIEFSQDQKADTESIKERLRNYSMTGQYTNALIISNDQKDAKGDVVLDNECIKEIVYYINPSKLILNKIKANEKQFHHYTDWNSTALKFFIQVPKPKGDYSGKGNESKQDVINEVRSDSEKNKMKKILPSFKFLKPKKPEIPGVLSSIDDALKEPSFWEPERCPSHTVYVIK